MTVLGRYNQSWHRLGEGVRPHQTVAPEPPSSGDPNELLTLAEAGDLLGLTWHQMLHKIKGGRLRARKMSRYWYLSRAEVERFARRMEAKS